MPVAQQAAGEPVEQQVDDDPGQRQQQQRGEEARDREAVAGFEDAEGEPGFGTAGAGDKLGDNRADSEEAAKVTAAKRS